MDALKDTNVPSGTTEADAADLLRACTPYSPPAGRKERVRAAISGREIVRRPVGLWLRPALVTLFVLAIVTTASSSMGRTWVGKIYRQITGAPAPAQQPAATPSRHRRVHAAAAQPALPAEQPAPATPVAAPMQEPLPAAVAAPVPAPAPATARHHQMRAPSTAVERVRSAEDAGLVVAGMQALRSSGDPVKAGALLDEYLRRHPRGILAEEALTLAIEAALARGDGRARPLAQQYLSRYPKGAYRQTAERAAQ